MAAKTPAQLKAYFNTGDMPTEAQYGDVFDSFIPVLQGWIETAGQALQFDESNRGRIYGQDVAISTNPTLNETDAEVGGQVLVRWNSANPPAFPAGITDDGAIAGHTPNIDYYFRVECLSVSPFSARAYAESSLATAAQKLIETSSNSIYLENYQDSYRAHVVGDNVVGINSTPYNLPAKAYDWAGKTYLCDASSSAITVVVPTFALGAATPFSFSVAALGGNVTVRFTGGGFNADSAAHGPFDLTDNAGNDEITLTDGQWAEFTHSSENASGWSIGKWGGTGNGGAVDSVNGQTGAVVLDPDDLDDAATAHQFVSAAEKATIAAALTNPLGTDLDLGGNDLLNVGNELDLSPTITLPPSGVLAPIELKYGPHFEGSHAQPATSGSLDVASSQGAGARAEVLYQAASAPTAGAGVDDFYSSNWDATNINVLIVYEHGDGRYIATHGGSRTI